MLDWGLSKEGGVIQQRNILSNRQQHSMKTPTFDNDPVVQQAHSDSNFRALQLLKETELSLQAAHNRIKVLQAQELRNQAKAQQSLGQVHRIQQARQAEQQHLSLINSRQMQLQELRQEQALRSQHFRTEQQAGVERSQEKLRVQRRQQYQTVEESSVRAQEVISQSRLQELACKEQHCEEAGQEQEAARQKLIRYHEEKQLRLKQQKHHEVQGFQLRQQMTRTTLDTLGHLEMQLLAKQSQSKAAYLQARKLLDGVLTNSKHQEPRDQQLNKEGRDQKSIERRDKESKEGRDKENRGGS